MDDNLLQFALWAFVTLFVVVDPLGVTPSFVALTGEYGTVERNRTLRRALVVAFGVTLFFLLCGRWLLNYLGVTVHAFAISGGILLFAASWPMLFGHRAGLQAPSVAYRARRAKISRYFPWRSRSFPALAPSPRSCCSPIDRTPMLCV